MSTTEIFLGHDGSAPGYRSVLFYQPDKKLTLAIMTNYYGADIYALARALYAALPEFTCGNANRKEEKGIEHHVKGRLAGGLSCKKCIAPLGHVSHIRNNAPSGESCRYYPGERKAVNIGIGIRERGLSGKLENGIKGTDIVMR